ncbi:MAG TPA: 3,4-dihydroxy-2-butanone-4-phosphate synthase [Candidatus Thermoplasmatota archaeon]|nr:3,4-dihydroxy-2-butanone-4-phosphate synthase [Candidatus Thermoplasmatota archaeon]
MSPLESACRALRDGKFVLLYDQDGREEEVDLFVAAEHATPEAVRTLRKDAGGLVFLAVDPRVGHALELPFLQDLYAEDSARHPVLKRLIPNDIKYDTRSSFSLTINHRETFTGITDNDRSLTITRFAELARKPTVEEFGRQFRAPGHVHLCVGADKLLHQRQGHTEIAVALARPPVSASISQPARTGVRPARRALPKADALRWAEKHDAVLLDGNDVQSAWLKLEAAMPRSA